MSDLGPASISRATFDAQRAAKLPEQQLQELILAAAARYGWLGYHTHDSRRSQAGFPDLVLVHEGRRLTLFRELKKQNGRATPEQKEWLAALTAAGQDAAIWRPLDWFDETIPNLLAGVTP